MTVLLVSETATGSVMKSRWKHWKLGLYGSL